jgi:hypothetical protein
VLLINEVYFGSIASTTTRQQPKRRQPLKNSSAVKEVSHQAVLMVLLRNSYSIGTDWIRHHLYCVYTVAPALDTAGQPLQPVHTPPKTASATHDQVQQFQQFIATILELRFISLYPEIMSAMQTKVSSTKLLNPQHQVTNSPPKVPRLRSLLFTEILSWYLALLQLISR